MATNSENTPARRVEDHHPTAKIDWSKPGAPAVPQSSAAGAVEGGNTSLTDAHRKAINSAAECVESYGRGDLASVLREVLAATIPPSTAPAPQTNDEQAEKCNLRLCCRGDAHAAGCTTYDPSRYPDEAGPAPQTDELRKLVNAHCNDLLDCAAILHDDGRFKRTAEEIRTAVAELRAAMKAAPAPQQSELLEPRIKELAEEHLSYVFTSEIGEVIDFARAIEREVLAKAAQAAPSVPADAIALLQRMLDNEFGKPGWPTVLEVEQCIAASKAAPALPAQAPASAVQAEPVAWMADGQLFSSADCIPPRLLPPIGKPVPLYAAPVAAVQDEVRDRARDTELLDWLDQNIFHHEMDDFDRKRAPDSSQWLIWSTKEARGSARDIIGEAMERDRTPSTGQTSEGEST